MPDSALASVRCLSFPLKLTSKLKFIVAPRASMIYGDLRGPLSRMGRRAPQKGGRVGIGTRQV